VHHAPSLGPVIHIALLTGMCGDGKVGAGEQCDDGNTASGDGCSSTCTIEGFDAHHCHPSCHNQCNVQDPPLSNPTVPPPHCGDGTIDADEECDDGGTASGDGCSSICKIEGMAPTMRQHQKHVCHLQQCQHSFHFHPHSGTCGDGSLGAGEECDDGNAVSGDGCSSSCMDEGSGQPA